VPPLNEAIVRISSGIPFCLPITYSKAPPKVHECNTSQWQRNLGKEGVSFRVFIFKTMLFLKSCLQQAQCPILTHNCLMENLNASERLLDYSNYRVQPYAIVYLFLGSTTPSTTFSWVATFICLSLWFCSWVQYH